jgi:hypothetical protein
MPPVIGEDSLLSQQQQPKSANRFVYHLSTMGNVFKEIWAAIVRSILDAIAHCNGTKAIEEARLTREKWEAELRAEDERMSAELTADDERLDQERGELEESECEAAQEYAQALEDARLAREAEEKRLAEAAAAEAEAVRIAAEIASAANKENATFDGINPLNKKGRDDAVVSKKLNKHWRKVPPASNLAPQTTTNDQGCEFYWCGECKYWTTTHLTVAHVDAVHNKKKGKKKNARKGGLQQKNLQSAYV